MKWVYLIGAGIVGLVAVVAAIGALLPRGHRATRQARFRQKPEAIYFTLAGPVDWRSDIKAFGNLPDRDGRKQWWEQDSHGHKVAYELREDVMPSRRVTRIVGKDLPFGGTWTIEIAPAPDGSVVRITEDGEVYNVIFRFMARFIFGYTATIEGYLRDLGHRFGELTVIEP
ncbi:MAG: hypothetical protein ABI806_20020 [Candidatus Solibacter sp.]